MQFKKFIFLIGIAIFLVIAVYLLIEKPACLFWPLSEDFGNIKEKQDLIKLTTPQPNYLINSPLEIKGEARGFWFFEASFPIKLLDGNGEIIGTAIAQAKGDWMTENFVPFEAVLEFNTPQIKEGTLILMKDNPSGLPENDDELRILVRFSPGGTTEKTFLKIYFNNSKMDAEFSCNKVFPVKRIVDKTQAPARKALELLLSGPAESEKEKGFFTSINLGVKIQSLSITEGTAKVDFDEQLEFQVGGSCRVSAIRSEITETLKQFPTVNQVIISINGRTEDILQP